MADNKSCEELNKQEAKEWREYASKPFSKEEEEFLAGTDYGTSESKSSGTITVDFDCADALKGLKAVQREAKKATAALKEYDNVVKHTCPECKTISLDLNILTADTQLYQTHRHCYHCGYKDVLEHD
ncbi:hypothetical protein [Oceanobacillus sp. FSL W7-1309]|uniref:hypothetical protein n=1 Tax=Oceanobacillus sp. FSL W7-1309 TaxID=2954539 RepID=UPI0030F9D478